jgi:hypothetical protein
MKAADCEDSALQFCVNGNVHWTPRRWLQGFGTFYKCLSKESDKTTCRSGAIEDGRPDPYGRGDIGIAADALITPCVESLLLASPLFLLDLHFCSNTPDSSIAIDRARAQDLCRLSATL